jgi:lauroyl/myristoyl acyltransferase
MTEEATLNKKSRPPLITPGDLEHAAALVLATGLNLLPAALRARVIHQLSRMVGTIWYRTNRGTVRRVRHHLQILFNDKGANAALESLVRDQLILAAWNALMTNLLPSLRDEHLAHLLQIEGLHYVDEMRRQNEPILLLGFHYGAYGYAIAATLTAQGYPTWLFGYGDAHSSPPGTSHLYRKLYWPRVQRLQQRVRMTTVEPGKKTQPELARILAGKDSIAYLLADQYFVVGPGQKPPSHLAPLRLLNCTVYLDMSGVQLAKQMGAQPLTAVPVRDGRVLIEPLEWVSNGTATTDIARDLQLYLARLEQRLVEYPALWRDLRRQDLLARMGIFEGEGAIGR